MTLTRDKIGFPIYTSDVTLYDGITLDIAAALGSDPTLNKVIEELDAAITAVSVSETTTLASNAITMSSGLSGGSIDISAGDTLTSALSDIVGQVAVNESSFSSYVTKSLFDAHTVLYATADDTPLALTVAASTVVGRTAAGNIDALTMTELAEELNLTFRDSTDGFVRPWTNTDAFAVGAESVADKVLIYPLESATFSENPLISWNHSIRNADDYGLHIEGYTSKEITTKIISNRNDNNLIIASEETGADSKDQAIVLSDDIDGATLRYWEIAKDGADSRKLKFNYKGAGAEATMLTLDTSGGLTLQGGTVTVTDILDEDAMGSDSDTKLATQQSIKAYVDGEIATLDSSLSADINILDAYYDHTSDGADKSTLLIVATFDYSDQSVAGTHSIFGDTDIPDNAILKDAWVDVSAAFTDDGGNTSTIGIGIENVGAGVEDIKNAAAIGTDYGSGVLVEAGVGGATDLDFDVASPVKTTAAKDVTINVVLAGGATTLSTGRMTIFIEYFVGK